MNISICITTFNEEESIKSLLDSLVHQSKKADEIIIVDGGSTDKTIEIINRFQKKFAKIKLVKKRCSRAKGRNLSIGLAKNELIAITDAGCVAQKDWLKNISLSFINPKIDIVAGYYKMVGKNSMQKAMSIFLGVTPRKFSNTFLPSTRSMAFRKSAWQKIGGFPEEGKNSAEDTNFNYKALNFGLKYARVKNAQVEWGMPGSMTEFRNKIYDYAKWDAQYGIWWHPTQRLMSHNIKVLTIIFRYLILLLLFILSLKFYSLFPIPIILFFIYMIWAYSKVFKEFEDSKVAVWGPILQITSDLAVMSGFVSGIIS